MYVNSRSRHEPRISERDERFLARIQKICETSKVSKEIPEKRVQGWSGVGRPNSINIF